MVKSLQCGGAERNVHPTQPGSAGQTPSILAARPEPTFPTEWHQKRAPSLYYRRMRETLESTRSPNEIVRGMTLSEFWEGGVPALQISFVSTTLQISFFITNLHTLFPTPPRPCCDSFSRYCPFPKYQIFSPQGGIE